MEIVKHSQVVSVSVPLKSFTHSALKETCFSYGLITTSDLQHQKECVMYVGKALNENKNLMLELKLKNDKILVLESELKKKQEERDFIYNKGVELQNNRTELQNKANFWYQQAIDRIKELESTNKQNTDRIKELESMYQQAMDKIKELKN